MTLDYFVLILYLLLLPTLVIAQATSEGMRDSGNKMWAGVVFDVMMALLIVAFCAVGMAPFGKILTTYGTLELILIYLLWRYSIYDFVYNSENIYITNKWYVGQTKWTDILLRRFFPVENSRGWFLFITRALSLFVAFALSVKMFY